MWAVAPYGSYAPGYVRALCILPGYEDSPSFWSPRPDLAALPQGQAVGRPVRSRLSLRHREVFTPTRSPLIGP